MKQINNFPDYFIDENFEVWSIKNNKIKKKIPYQHKQGYLKHDFWKNGKRYKIYIHRIIAELFIPNPENLPYVRHLDDNPLNNSIENLAWGTNKDNVDDKIKNGNQLKGEEIVSSKLTKQQITEIREKYVPWKCTQEQLGKEYGVHASTISNIINNKQWNHI